MEKTGIRFFELKEKEVINISNCKRLGCITDLIIHPCTGEIEAIIIPGSAKLGGILGYDEEYWIPFGCIKKIGPDVILVDMKEEACLRPCK